MEWTRILPALLPRVTVLPAHLAPERDPTMSLIRRFSAPHPRMRTPRAVPPEPKPRDDVLTLVHRATFGYTALDYARGRSLGFDGWRDEQLDPLSIDDSVLEAELLAYPTRTLSAAELMTTYPQSMNGDRFVKDSLRLLQIIRAFGSKRQLFERVVDFWTDHFNIDGEEDVLRYLKTVDDREVVRTHALGSFRDLLGASAKSGAMLVYLDNYVNGGGSPNENYARELLELHTLGVDGGYTETDVVEVARCLTGWTIFDLGGPNAGEFRFDASLHDDGAKIVLGVAIPAGGGQQDGETVLDILAAHPSTRLHIARKLCARFLVDSPPQLTVDRVAQQFAQSSGDVSETLRAVLSLESFNETRIWTAHKLKRPLHLAVSSLRSTGGTITDPRGLRNELRFMGQLPFAWAAPNGYPDTAEAWGSNLLPRWSFVSKLLDDEVDGAEVSNAAISALFASAPTGRAALTLNARLTGGRMSRVDIQAVQDFMDGQPTMSPTVAREAVALALSLPSTQWT